MKHRKEEFLQSLPLPQEHPMEEIVHLQQNELVDEGVHTNYNNKKDMCFPFSPNIDTKTSEAPFTTAGIFSKSDAQLTNPVI